MLVRYRAHGICESRGSRKGVIIDLEKAITSVQQAVERAENAAGAPVEHAVVGVAGAHIRGITSQGGITLGSKAREVTKEDIRQAVERAKSINCRWTARSCICCRRSSFSTISPDCANPRE